MTIDDQTRDHGHTRVHVRTGPNAVSRVVHAWTKRGQQLWNQTDLKSTRIQRPVTCLGLPPNASASDFSLNVCYGDRALNLLVYQAPGL